MRRINWLLSCMAVMLLCGCGRAEEQESKKRIKIGVTVYDRYDTYLKEYMDIFESLMAERRTAGAQEISVEISDSVTSQLTQNEQVSNMIQNGCDVLCVNLVDRTAPLQIIDEAKRNDIPVIFFNRELVEEDLMRWSQLYYVGADAEESGRMEGELAAEDILKKSVDETAETEPAAASESGQIAASDLTAEGGAAVFSAADRNRDGVIQYVVLEGEAGHQDTIIRSEASVKAITDAGIRVEKLGYGIANWNRAEAQNRMKQLYDSYGTEIELILCNNDDMALGVLDAYEGFGVSPEDRPLIYGIDGTTVGLDAVYKGGLAGTVYNDKEAQAEALCELAMRLSNHESLDDLPLKDGKYIQTPYQKVTRENVQEFMKRQN